MLTIVAMSGGVDSSSAARLLRDAGHEVLGLTLRLWRTSRLSEDYIERAKRVCEALGIPHRTVDLREEFGRTIVDEFCAEYLRGRTPNPCVLCNPLIKVPALLREAEACGARRVATGHYARVVARPDGGCELRRGADRRKDQSYVLYRLGQAQLRRIAFPLGERYKRDVREQARQFWPWDELPAESQEVCFLPPGGYPEFIRERVSRHPEARRFLRPGRVVDTQGNVLARHRGIFNFTIGQRRRLGFAAGKPMYVVRIEPRTDTVVVAERAETYRRRFTVTDVTWCSGESPLAEGRPAVRAAVKIRYTHPAAEATIRAAGDQVQVAFEAPQHAVTPGQSAVFYDDDIVLGGGIIDRVMDDADPETP